MSHLHAGDDETECCDGCGSAGRPLCAHSDSGYLSPMRLLAVLLFLLTPLRGVAAAALCYAAEHGAAVACEPGMAGASGHDGMPGDQGPMPGAPHVAAIDLAADLDGLLGCSAIGLCAATPSSIAASIATLPQERVTDAGPATPLPHFGPGIRPAPPIHPPRA